MRRGLRDVIGRKARRMVEGRSARERLWAGVGVVGSVGWMIALPTALGAYAGRRLDARWGTEPQLALSLLLLGLFVGLYTVYRVFWRELR